MVSTLRVVSQLNLCLLFVNSDHSINLSPFSSSLRRSHLAPTSLIYNIVYGIRRLATSGGGNTRCVWSQTIMLTDSRNSYTDKLNNNNNNNNNHVRLLD